MTLAKLIVDYPYTQGNDLPRRDGLLGFRGSMSARSEVGASPVAPRTVTGSVASPACSLRERRVASNRFRVDGQCADASDLAALNVDVNMSSMMFDQDGQRRRVTGEGGAVAEHLD
jgi:hypothetical protein